MFKKHINGIVSLIVGLMLVGAFALAFTACATAGVNNSTGGDKLLISRGDWLKQQSWWLEQFWLKENFHSTEDEPWFSRDYPLTLVFTETQLKFGCDLNGNGSFGDAGEYTYTFTITNFEGNDFRWKGNDWDGDYDRRITVNNKVKTGSGTNADFESRDITEFWVAPNLGSDQKLDGNIWVHINGEINGKNLGMFNPPWKWL